MVVFVLKAPRPVRLQPTWTIAPSYRIEGLPLDRFLRKSAACPGQAVRRTGRISAFRAVSFFLFQEFLSDDVQRLIPADPLEFTLSFLPDAFQRVFEPLRRIDPLRSSMGLGAISPLVSGSFLHAFDSYKPSVPDDGIDPTPHTGSAHCAKSGNRGLYRWRHRRIRGLREQAHLAILQ